MGWGGDIDRSKVKTELREKGRGNYMGRQQAEIRRGQ